MRWVPFVIVLWAVLGYLGWGWANYCAHLAIGDRADQEPAKWKLFRLSFLLGPLMILANWGFQRRHGHMHFGLRFK